MNMLAVRVKRHCELFGFGLLSVLNFNFVLSSVKNTLFRYILLNF